MKIISQEELENRLDDNNLYWSLRRRLTWVRINLSPRVILHRLRRTTLLIRVYWSTGDYDWSTIPILMRYQIKRTRVHIKECNIATKTDRVCRDMLVTENLLDRIIKEDYWEKAEQRYPDNVKLQMDFTRDLERQDLDLLADMLRKHLMEWWD